MTTPEYSEAKLQHLLDQPFERRSRLAFARLGAEVGSTAGSFGTIFLLKKLAPEHLDAWKNVVAEKLVKPHLHGFEAVLDQFSGLEPDAKSRKRDKMNDDEKAKYIANLVVNFAILSASGVAFQAAGQGAADRMMGMPPIRGSLWVQTSKQVGAVLLDKAVHGAAFVGLNTIFKEQNEELQTATSNIMQHTMNSKENADMFASYLTNWSLPTIAGMFGSVAKLDNVYRKDIAERLSEMRGTGKA